MLIQEFHSLLERGWQSAFPGARSQKRAIQHAIALPCVFGRRTISRTLGALGRWDQDWSADYKMFSRCRWKPERLFDVETGWELRTAKTSIAATLYAMEFHNEIASTGELSDIGLLLRRNVDRAYLPPDVGQLVESRRAFNRRHLWLDAARLRRVHVDRHRRAARRRSRWALQGRRLEGRRELGSR